jgi:peroxiredoxin
MRAAELRAGDRAPQLSGRLADGTPFDLAGARARPTLIEFHRGTW